MKHIKEKGLVYLFHVIGKKTKQNIKRPLSLLHFAVVLCLK